MAGSARTTGRGWTKARQRDFLEHLATTMNVRASARAVGMGEQGAYRLRARDEAFRAGWSEAIAEAYERLELQMLRRAIGGTVEETGVDGQGAGTTDSRLAMFLMKMHRETARSARPAGNGTGDAVVVDELEAKLDAMRERMGAAEQDA